MNLKNILDNIDSFCSQIDFYHKREKSAIKKLHRKIENTNFEEIDNYELNNLLIEWYNTTLNDIFVFNLAPIEYSITYAMKKCLENYDVKNEDKVISIMFTSNRMTWARRELLDLYEGTVKCNKDIFLFEHYKKYRSLPCGYGNAEWSLKDFEDRYEAAKAKGYQWLKNEISEIYDDIDRLNQERKNILSDFSEDRILKLADCGKKIGELRDNNKALLGESILDRNRIIDEVVQRFPREKDNLLLFFLEEISCLLLDNKSVDSLQIAKRRRGVLLQSRLEYAVDEQAREMFASIQNKTDKLGDVYYGSCSSVGMVRGIARICKKADDCKKIKKGDILIAHGTDFDYILGINRADAIVTEEGGMLSHASVISRELKKPCIVGVKNITRGVKDGDYIEVDAEKGKVSVLSRYSIDKKTGCSVEGIYNLRDSHLLDDKNVGGKAFNLSKLIRKGICVPDAIVLSDKYFIHLLERNGVLKDFNKLKKDMKNNINRIVELLDKIDKDLLDVDKLLPSADYYAVRSSGGQEDGKKYSFAGQHESILFCDNIDSIRDAIISCWKSFYSDRAYLYRNKMGVPLHDIMGGVIVQEMIISEWSGVIFSRNPVSGKKEFVIEFCEGQCRNVVDGSKKPSRYICSIDNGSIIESKIEKEVVLNRNMLKGLIDNMYKIMTILGDEIDVEWCVANETIYILQCRPLTC